MNKLLRSLLFALVLASLMSSLVFGAGGAAPAYQTASGNQAVIRFDMLGEADTLLRGPYGSKTIRFGLPANWAYQQGAALQLVMTANVIAGTAQTVVEGQVTGATLNVSFDKEAVATVPIVAGSNVTYDIAIPATALDSPFSDGRHELLLFLDAGNDCTDPSRQTSVVISAASHLTIKFAEQEPAIDLTTLPRPIFQRDSIFPVETALIVPDEPTASELQAALTVAAGFGRMSGGDMSVNLVPMSALTPEQRTDSQLIFVGKSSTLSLLQGASLPSPLQGNAFAAPGMQDDDGILQMAISPWNTGRAVLVVGGNTDTGVVKAAQALTNTNIQTVGDRSLALIANVQAPSSGLQGSSTVLPQEVQSFGNLGYGITTMNGVGRSETFVRFTVPPGLVVTGDAYLDLTFNHSGLLDFNRSGLTVFLNGNLIGSVLLSEETATTTTQRIKIPLSSLSTSTNELKFEADLAPLSQCSFLDFSNLWLSILPESTLTLPLMPATADTVQMRDMGAYPYPFTSEPTLSNLDFVLSKNDPASWDIAAQIALQLGRSASGALFSPGVVFDGELTDEVRTESNMIVVGLPTNMQILRELNESMPAPFEVGSNVAVLQGQQVAYRFPAESDLGFLELLPSPWNAENAILAVLGTTPEGVRQAGNALTDAQLRSQLKGNFVLVNGESLSVADTRTGLGLAGVSASGSASAELPVTSEETEPQPAPSVFDGSNVSWIPMAIGGLLVAILLVLIIAALTRRRVVVR